MKIDHLKNSVRLAKKLRIVQNTCELLSKRVQVLEDKAKTAKVVEKEIVKLSTKYENKISELEEENQRLRAMLKTKQIIPIKKDKVI